MGLNSVRTKCRKWLSGGLMCTICYPCAMYTSRQDIVLCIRGCVSMFFEAPFYSYIIPYLFNMLPDQLLKMNTYNLSMKICSRMKVKSKFNLKYYCFTKTGVFSAVLLCEAVKTFFRSLIRSNECSLCMYSNWVMEVTCINSPCDMYIYIGLYFCRNNFIPYVYIYYVASC